MIILCDMDLKRRTTDEQQKTKQTNPLFFFT